MYVCTVIYCYRYVFIYCLQYLHGIMHPSGTGIPSDLFFLFLLLSLFLHMCILHCLIFNRSLVLLCVILQQHSCLPSCFLNAATTISIYKDRLLFASTFTVATTFKNLLTATDMYMSLCSSSMTSTIGMHHASPGSA